MYWYCENSETNIITDDPNEAKTVSMGGKWTHIVPSETKEKLLEGIHDKPCRICGKLIHYGSYNDKCKAKLAEACLCHSCDFWSDIQKTIDDPRRVIVKGVAYWRKDYINVDKRLEHTLGFSGHVFGIKMNTGEEYTTNDLWRNGDIPERFREVLKDNAIFL